jgi:hypothetical protein
MKIFVAGVVYRGCPSGVARPIYTEGSENAEGEGNCDALVRRESWRKGKLCLRRGGGDGNDGNKNWLVWSGGRLSIVEGAAGMNLGSRARNWMELAPATQRTEAKVAKVGTIQVEVFSKN